MTSLFSAGSTGLALLFATFIGHASALADDAPVLATRFEQLESRYAAGTLPTFESLEGWFSGRCIRAARPDTSTNALMLGWTEFDGEEHDPIFPGRKVFKVLWAQGAGKSADYFDQLDFDIEGRIQLYLVTEGRFALEPRIESDALIGGRRHVATWSMRLSGDTVLMQNLVNGKVVEYCYTFKKVR